MLLQIYLLFASLLLIKSPNQDTIWINGKQVEISWRFNGNNTKISADLITENKTRVFGVFSAVDSNLSSQNYIIPSDVQAGNYFIQMFWDSGNTTKSNIFTIQQKTTSALDADSDNNHFYLSCAILFGIIAILSIFLIAVTLACKLYKSQECHCNNTCSLHRMDTEKTLTRDP